MRPTFCYTFRPTSSFYRVGENSNLLNRDINVVQKVCTEFSVDLKWCTVIYFYNHSYSKHEVIFVYYNQFMLFLGHISVYATCKCIITVYLYLVTLFMLKYLAVLQNCQTMLFVSDFVIGFFSLFLAMDFIIQTCIFP